MPLFQRRHYDLLAWWAGTNLDSKTLSSLLTLLADDNPAFQKRRALAELAQAPGYTTKPKPIEDNLDDAIINSEK